MRPPVDRLVYYSLSAGPDGRAARAIEQLLGSIRSLRAHNRAIPVRLFLCGSLPAETRADLAALDVTIEEHGPYEDHLRGFAPPRMAEVFARLPVLHYATSLAKLAREDDVGRVLYLDGDTFFFGDVGRLFDRYAELDLYAREEPLSRRSILGPRPDVFDEAAVEALAAREGARFVPPFNNGVMLMSARFVRALAARLEAMLRDVFRFSVWLTGRPHDGGPAYQDLDHLRAHRARLVTPEDEADALAYPLENRWIKDQLALWLNVGKIPDAGVGIFSPRDVMQGHEFTLGGVVTQTVAHYFSGNMRLFERWREQRAGEPSLPRAAASPSAGGMEAFVELGNAIEDAWERVHHDEQAFPAIATELLRAADLPARVGIDDVVRWILAARTIPAQDDIAADFGEPPITVFAAPRFYVQVILWLQGSTAVHRHSFSGAFQVLAGSSVHAQYGFHPRRRINTGLVVGDVRLQRAELLRRGDLRAIENDLIHSLFHLDNPSATIVVRTRREDEAQPQYDYLPPHLAYVRDAADRPTLRRTQVLKFLWESKHPGSEALAVELLDRVDLLATFHHLRAACRARGIGEPVALLFAAARRRHGPVVDEIAASLREEARRRTVGNLRRRTRDDDQSFFLALLQNLPHRDAVFEVIRARWPEGDPRARVLGFLSALSGVDRIGVDLGDPLNAALVPALLDGASSEEIRARLGEIFDPETVRAQAEAIDAHAERIRGTMLAPLFRAAPPA
jgi:hypothetical protein